MKNREKHKDKLFKEWKLTEQLLDKTEWCSREDAKEIIDDLNDDEFFLIIHTLTDIWLRSAVSKHPKEKSEVDREIDREIKAQGKSCSFCGKVDGEAKRIISGPPKIIAICCECIDFTKDILTEEQVLK